MVRGEQAQKEREISEVDTHATVKFQRGPGVNTFKAKGYKNGVFQLERHRDGIIARKDNEAVLIPWNNIRYVVYQPE